MLDFTSLPASKAVAINESLPFEENIDYTFTECIDEGFLYKELKARLSKLEVAVEVNEEELKDIQKKAAGFKIATEEREEIMLRCTWLENLYQVNSALPAVDSKAQAVKLRSSLQSVQTSPLKKELIERLFLLEKSFDDETTIVTFEEKLMNEAVKQADAVFVNLGVAGRKYIVSSAVEKHGEKVQLTHLNQLAAELEEKVEALTTMDQAVKLKTRLEKLPLMHFPNLSALEKQQISQLLMENRDWHSLAELQRKINRHLKNLILQKEEQIIAENTINTSNGDVAQTLNIGKEIQDFLRIKDSQ